VQLGDYIPDEAEPKRVQQELGEGPDTELREQSLKRETLDRAALPAAPTGNSLDSERQSPEDGRSKIRAVTRSKRSGGTSTAGKWERAICDRLKRLQGVRFLGVGLRGIEGTHRGHGRSEEGAWRRETRRRMGSPSQVPFSSPVLAATQLWPAKPSRKSSSSKLSGLG
jgi:hypothetical protein